MPETCHDYYPKHSVFESRVQIHFTPYIPANCFYRAACCVRLNLTNMMFLDHVQCSAN